MVLEFEKDELFVEFKTSKGVTATTYNMHVCATNKSDGGDAVKVYISKNESLKEGNNRWRIKIDYVFYNKVAKRVVVPGKPLPNIIDFIFKVVIEKEETKIVGQVSVHFVRYIPKLLNILGWTNGEKLQRIWFTEGNLIKRETEAPKLNIITWNWVMQSSDEAKEEYIEFRKDTLDKLNSFFDNNIKRSLKSQINKMAKEGLATIPTKNNPRTKFGVYSEEIITESTHRFPHGEKLPKFEKYYFNSKSFSGPFDLGKHYLRNLMELDDFIATLATFNYHVLASGYLSYKKGGYFSADYIEVTVDTLGFYVKDSFDFIDDNPNVSQPLGFWKIISDRKIEVVKDAHNKDQYYEITNKSYRDYRDAHSMGYNFHLYSTIFRVEALVSFKL